MTPIQGQLVAAYREEAALFRRDGKEGAALRLEQLADRAEQAQNNHVPKNKESTCH